LANLKEYLSIYFGRLGRLLKTSVMKTDFPM